MGDTKMKVWYLVLVITSLLQQKTAYGILCLKCDGITQPRFCNKVVECYQNELCGVEKVVNDFGELVFNLGCFSRQVCSNVTSEQQMSSSKACWECCESGDLCNSQGCGEPGYPSTRGPICYNCPIHEHAGHGQCHNIQFCSDNEVCSVVGKSLFSNLVYTSKCLSKHGCNIADNTHAAVIGKRDVVPAKRTLERHVCDTCCTTDLCNRDCDSALSAIDHCKPNPCVNGLCEMIGESFECTCYPGFSGILCDSVYAKDCYDLYHKFHVTDDGIYNITTWKSQEHINVYCDMTTAGGGWTVFQNRYDGSLDFHKSFEQYENGFGSLHGEFWLGLKYVHEMTSLQKTELRIDLENFERKTAYENFQNFSVSAGPNYTLHILRGTGTAGDSGNGLSYHNNMHFTTFDHDNDNNMKGNCAAVSNNPGGWWFNYCYVANLNGGYEYNYSGTMGYFNFSSSLKTSKMMLRKVS